MYEEEISDIDIISDYSLKRKMKASKSKYLDNTNSQSVDI